MAFAQLKLTFSNPGERIVWVGTLVPDAPKNPQTITGTTFELSKDDLAQGEAVKICDVKSNNLAQKAVASLGAEWKVNAQEFNRLGRAQILVLRDNRPAAAANVTLKVGKETFQRVIANAPDGVDLYGLPPGKIEASASYTSGGQTKPASTMTYFTPLKRPMAMITIGFVLPDADVIETPEKSKPPETAVESPATPTKSPVPDVPVWRTALNYLLALVVGAAIVYAIVKWLPKNAKAINTQLEKVGIQIPEDAPASDDSVVPASATPEPMKPIVLDPLEADMPSNVAMAVVSNPRLVAPSGEILLIPEGTSIVGRDASADLAWPNEASISRRHAQFERLDGVITLTDLGSTNGTFINGVQPSGPTQIRPGDSIQLGAASFRYEE